MISLSAIVTRISLLLKRISDKTEKSEMPQEAQVQKWGYSDYFQG